MPTGNSSTDESSTGQAAMPTGNSSADEATQAKHLCLLETTLNPFAPEKGATPGWISFSLVFFLLLWK